MVRKEAEFDGLDISLLKEIFKLFLAKIRIEAANPKTYDDLIGPVEILNYFPNLSDKLDSRVPWNELISLELVVPPNIGCDSHLFITPGGGLVLALFLDQKINNLAQRGGRGEKKGLRQLAQCTCHLVNWSLMDACLVDNAKPFLTACQRDYLQADLFCPCPNCERIKTDLEKRS